MGLVPIRSADITVATLAGGPRILPRCLPDDCWTLRRTSWSRLAMSRGPIGDFLDRFTPGRYTLRAKERTAFRARLADIVALVVRDEVFMRIGRSEGLDESEDFARELGLWRNHWLFQAKRNALVSESGIGDRDRTAEVRATLAPFRRLAQAELRRRNQ